MGSTKINLTEEQFTEVTLSALKEHPEGITEYPILDFDDRALGLLSAGVAETLRYSEIKPRGGLAYRFLKRLFDIVGSALLLILLAIPMGIVALVIYLDDKGSPIFSQARLTKDGKVFYMHKFRSMCVDAEQKFAEVQKENETDGLAFKSENDPRITRIGHFIRRTSIDELPQLWDVFCGHMSIIGAASAASAGSGTVYAPPDAAVTGKRRSVLYLSGRGQKRYGIRKVGGIRPRIHSDTQCRTGSEADV